MEDDELLDDLDDNLDDEVGAGDDADKGPTEDERIAAGVQKALASMGIQPVPAKANEPPPFHPGTTPSEVYANSVRSSVQVLSERDDLVDEALEEVKAATKGRLTDDDIKDIRKQLRSMTPEQLKDSVGKKLHTQYAKSIVGERVLSENEKTKRRGVAPPPARGMGSGARGSGRASGVGEFESMYGKASATDRRRLREGGHI